MIEIRRATKSDFDGIWQIFSKVVKEGSTYTYHPETTKEQAYSIWMSEDVVTYVAVLDEAIAGTYILKPNQPGLGSHIANAGYMVSDDHAGKGIGRMMCQHSLEEARKAGYLAMQFNAVVSTNVRAVELWKKMGFAIIGTVPNAFRHQEQGFVDLFIMHRFL